MLDVVLLVTCAIGWSSKSWSKLLEMMCLIRFACHREVVTSCFKKYICDSNKYLFSQATIVSLALQYPL